MTCCKAHSVQRLRIFQIAADAIKAGLEGFLEGMLPAVFGLRRLLMVGLSIQDLR
jgi:hypothetical protein